MFLLKEPHDPERIIVDTKHDQTLIQITQLNWDQRSNKHRSETETVILVLNKVINLTPTCSVLLRSYPVNCVKSQTTELP